MEMNVTGRFSFEEALAMAGHGRFHHFLLLVNSLCYIAVVCELNSVSYLLPAADCDFKMTSDDKGLLVSMAYIGFIASSHFWGYMADTSGRRKVLLISLALDIICTIASSFSPNYYVFLVFRFFNGLFISCPASVVFTYISEFHGYATRARAIMLVSSAIALGSITLPYWSFELPSFLFNSWRIFVIMCAIPSILSFLLLLTCLPETPKYFLAQDKHKEAIAVLQRMYVVNTGKKKNTYEVKSAVDVSLEGSKAYNWKLDKSNYIMKIIKSMWCQTVPLFKRPFLLKMLLLCFLQFGVCACFQTMLLWMPEIFQRKADFRALNPDYSPTVCEAMNSALSHYQNSTNLRDETYYWSFNFSYTSDDGGLSARAVGMTRDCVVTVSEESFLYTLIVGAATALSGIVVGVIIAYVSEKTVNILISFGAGGIGIALNFATSTDLILTLICFFVSFTQCASGLINSITVDNFPTNLRAMAVCLSMMLGQVGSISGSLMIGALIDYNCLAIFFTLSGVAILCALSSFLLPGPFIKSRDKPGVKQKGNS